MDEFEGMVKDVEEAGAALATMGFRTALVIVCVKCGMKLETAGSPPTMKEAAIAYRHSTVCSTAF